MASYTVAANQRGAYENAASAGVVDTVTFTEDLGVVEIGYPSGTAPLYISFDGSTPSDKNAACEIAYPGQTVQLEPKTSGPTVVKLVCRAAAVYSVNKV